MTAPHASNLPPTTGAPEEMPFQRLSTELDMMLPGEGGRSLPIRSVLPGVPAEAWNAFDVQTEVARSLDRDALPGLLARSVAGVVAASSGAEYDFGTTVIGPSGHKEPFVERFSRRLATIANIPPDDEDRNRLLDRCERDLERCLVDGMKKRGLVSSGGDQVWVVDGWQAAGTRSRSAAKERSALLATVATRMFTAALAGRPSEQARQRSRFLLPPRQVTFEELQQEAAQRARHEIDKRQ